MRMLSRILLALLAIAMPAVALFPDQLANVVVSQDGHGDVKTIGEAITLASRRKGTSRFVIHVKAGTYYEYVVVPSSLPYITLVGDGMGVTVITGDRSMAGGYETFYTSTVAVDADGFIARDLTIRNTAGPNGAQALALRLSGDMSVVFRCSIEGFQDTLCANHNRQFYRECNIYGTIDFIFGFATAVFQYCNIYVRDSPNTANTITAHGRSEATQSSGYVFQNSYVRAHGWDPKQRPNVRTYLGRPWRPFSRTVFMDTLLDDLINPEGWLAMGSTSDLATLYYAEFKNYGGGSRTDGRVRWPGYKIITNPAEAQKFTVANFINGGSWLPSTGVPYKLGL